MTEHADRRTDHGRHESDADPSSEDDLAEASHQDLVDEVRALRTRVDDLEAENAEVKAENEELREILEDHGFRLDAASEQRDDVLSKIEELQSRELEKGAHLLVENIDPDMIAVPEGRLEKITKADGAQYYRIPGADDLVVGTSGEVTTAVEDLLPIQQLARLDEDMIRAHVSSTPQRLAIALWQDREAGNVGTSMSPWRKGDGATVSEWVAASEVRSWIRSREEGISKESGKKLAQRTMESLHELSKHRLVKRQRNQRKNGLKYRETVVELRTDVELPGESPPAPAESDSPEGQESSPVG